MSTTIVTRTINAPIETVFPFVSDLRNYRKAVPYITKVEYHTEARTGVGTRFRETRVMGGREAASDFEVTKFVENDHVRIVTDNHGTVWDTVFSFRSTDGGTQLTMTMEARAYKLVARIMNVLIKRMIKRSIEKELDLVKAHLESAAPESA